MPSGSSPRPVVVPEENLMRPDDPPQHQGSPGAHNPHDAERLYRRRLRDVLGINPAGVEVILRLRERMIALQIQMRQLEAELDMREAGRQTRLRQHRETYFEASWQEL